MIPDLVDHRSSSDIEENDSISNWSLVTFKESRPTKTLKKTLQQVRLSMFLKTK